MRDLDRTIVDTELKRFLEEGRVCAQMLHRLYQDNISLVELAEMYAEGIDHQITSIDEEDPVYESIGTLAKKTVMDISGVFYHILDKNLARENYATPKVARQTIVNTVGTIKQLTLPNQDFIKKEMLSKPTTCRLMGFLADYGTKYLTKEAKGLGIYDSEKVQEHLEDALNSCLLITYKAIDFSIDDDCN